MENEEELENQYSICTTCGYMGWPKLKIIKHKSYVDEFIVVLLASLITFSISEIFDIDNFFILFLICIIAFTLEMRAYESKYQKKTVRVLCPKCKNPTMIPTDSPKGKELVEKQLLKAEKEKKKSLGIF